MWPQHLNQFLLLEKDTTIQRYKDKNSNRNYIYKYKHLWFLGNFDHDFLFLL